jgi:hypothetical protein
LEVRGDRLHVDAPKGVLKPEHREALASFKPELVQLVQKIKADVLQALITIGTWRTTKQIAAAVNRTEEAVLPILEALRGVGSLDRDGGPIDIWKAAIEEPRDGKMKASEAGSAPLPFVAPTKTLSVPNFSVNQGTFREKCGAYTQSQPNAYRAL